MAEAKRDGNTQRDQLVQANVLGTTRIAPSVRDALVHPDATPLREIPRDDGIETALSKVENLLGKGHYGAALREIDAVQIGDTPLATQYRFLLEGKAARAQLGIADRYFIRGDATNARRFYQQAIEVASADPAVRGIAETAGEVFDTLLRRRTELIQGLQESIRASKFDQWCGQKRELGDFTVLDDQRIRAQVAADFHLERVFGERPPIVPSPGYIDPLPLETDFIDFRSSLPGSVFSSTDSAALSQNPPAADTRVRASVAMPLVANVMQAKLGLLALDAGLNLTGQASGTVPLFRYEYLRDKANQTIARIQQIESRMLPIQFELDDFAEVTSAIRRPLAELEAELEAVKLRSNELVAELAALAQAKKAMEDVVIALKPIVDECEVEWWEWVAIIVWDIGILVAGIATAAAIAIALTATGNPVLGAALGSIVINAVIFVLIVPITFETLTCESILDKTDIFTGVIGRLQQSIDENQAELAHVLALRDVLIARINALQDELAEVYQSNAARVLDAKTLDLIQAQYNGIRQSLLTRAQAVAALAQDAFNFERDTELNLIRDAYFDSDRKDYSAAETLQRDLDGLDYVDLTGRTQKAMQLSHTVSLRRHYPMSFMTVRLTGGTRFTTELTEFDRWFPGTHQQRIKEIRVEVLIDGKPVPVRGYLSNDGVSMARFQDTGNKRPVDNAHVFPEPDADIAQLCYKRLQRRRHVDTMAFPELGSYLHEDRMRKLQDKERNFFENVGLESTWIIEFLPDQPIDLSKLTDVLIHFQYEALFDDNLKRILERKRYVGRRETSAIPIKQFLTEAGRSVDFSDTVSFTAPVHRVEAPGIERKIVNVGLVIKPKAQPHLDGPAELDISYDGASPIRVVTNEAGILATATDHPAGTGLPELEAMAHGKGIDKLWSIKIAALPAGSSTDVIDDVFLLLNCEYPS
jgi:Tc toxin complex TcA C-terminal TcB-binding domain